MYYNKRVPFIDVGDFSDCDFSGITNSNYAFQFSTFRKLIFPASLSIIGTDMFRYCYDTKEYHFQATTPPTLSNTNAFGSIASDCIIYVPRSENQTVLNDYKAATNWSTYASYIQEEPE